MMKVVFKYLLLFLCLGVLFFLFLMPVDLIVKRILPKNLQISYNVIEGNIHKGIVKDLYIKNEFMGNVNYKFKEIKFKEGAIVYHIKNDYQSPLFNGNIGFSFSKKLLFENFKLQGKFILDNEVLQPIDFIVSGQRLIVNKDKECLFAKSRLYVSINFAGLSKVKADGPIICKGSKLYINLNANHFLVNLKVEMIIEQMNKYQLIIKLFPLQGFFKNSLNANIWEEKGKYYEFSKEGFF